MRGGGNRRFDCILFRFCDLRFFIMGVRKMIKRKEESHKFTKDCKRGCLVFDNSVAMATAQWVSHFFPDVHFCRAGNNSRSLDIVLPNFEYVRSISHYDRT